MSIDEQRDKYYTEYKVSHSSLSWFEESAKYFKQKLDKEIEDEYKQYLAIGKKIHSYILEPEEFEKDYIYLEFETPKTEQQKNFCQNFIESKSKKVEDKAIQSYKDVYSIGSKSDTKIRDEALALKKKLNKYINYLKKRDKYRDILNKTDWELIQNSKKCILDHDLARELMINEDPILTDSLEIHNEFPIFWKVGSLELECKSLIDRVVFDHENKVIKLIDLKTTQYFKDFKDKTIDFNYLRQLAFYTLAIYWHFVNKTDYDIEQYRFDYYIVAIKKSNPIECKVYQYSRQDIYPYIDIIEKMFKNISWHFKNEKWDHSINYYENKGIE